jgi:DNA-binding NtrC family response regulator
MVHAVLVVDDDPAICAVVQAALEEDGAFLIMTVRRVEEARGLIGRIKPALVITDAILRDDPAADFATELRSQGLTTVVMTGDYLIADQLEAAGCRVLRKPFRLRALLDEVRDALVVSSQAGATPA